MQLGMKKLEADMPEKAVPVRKLGLQLLQEPQLMPCLLTPPSP